MVIIRHLFILVALGFGLTVAQDAPVPKPEIVDALVQYVRHHAMTPEEYLISKFRDHDIIFLGEWHRIKHDALLVQRLIPILHKQGVFSLGFEFARRVDQGLIDSLLTEPHYDEALARLILFRSFVHWGYQEYADILRSAWEVNRKLLPRQRRFRVLALGNSPDWSIVKTQEDRDRSEIKRKVWHGETEADWAAPLVAEVLNRGEKALVYCGSHHALTRYRFPIVIDGKFFRFDDPRLGNVIYERIGQRTFTILLHAPWLNARGPEKPSVSPADGYIDALLARLDRHSQHFGVDVIGTPFDSLPGETSIYQYGYPRFDLGTICDGYICQGSFDLYEGVTPIPHFITPENLEQARAQSPSPLFRNASISDFEESTAEDVNIRRKVKHLIR